MKKTMFLFVACSSLSSLYAMEPAYKQEFLRSSKDKAKQTVGIIVSDPTKQEGTPKIARVKSSEPIDIPSQSSMYFDSPCGSRGSSYSPHTPNTPKPVCGRDSGTDFYDGP